MGRRTAIALFAALAVLAVPSTASAASAISHPVDRGGDHHARVAAVDRHAEVVHAVAPASGRERRSTHHTSSSPAVVGGGVGIAPLAAWAGRDSVVASFGADGGSSSRPRAPPAVV